MMMRPPTFAARVMKPEQLKDFVSNFTDSRMTKKELERYAYHNRWLNPRDLLRYLDAGTGCLQLNTVLKLQRCREATDITPFLLHAFGSLKEAWKALDKKRPTSDVFFLPDVTRKLKIEA